MARPRAGGFCYTDDEWDTLLADAEWLAHHGAAGIAFGALYPDGSINVDRCRQLRQRLPDKQLVFHKAFDEVTDPLAALESLVDVGVDRMMTSGLATTAMEGAAMIGMLERQSQQRIEVLPAGGISSENAGQIVSETGCQQIHGSFRHADDGDIGQEIRRVIAGL